MKFQLKNANAFGWKGVKGHAYSTKEDFKNASVAYVEINGKHGKIRNIKSDRVYIIAEGKGKFIINDKVVPVEKMDVIIIPKNTPYDYQGEMKIFLVDCPAFEEDADIKLE